MNLKNISLLFVILFVSCSKESSVNIDIDACFEIDNVSLEVGKVFNIENCSSGAISYEFNFGNGSKSNEANPSISYDAPGEYSISLKITGQNGYTKSISKKVTVTPIKNSLVFPPLLHGDFVFPTDFGIIDGNFYYIEYYSNIFNGGLRSHNYIEIDDDFNFSKKILGDRHYNSSHSSLSLLSNGQRIVHTVESMTDRIGSSEIWLDDKWNTQTAEYSSSKPIYGSIKVEEDLIFFGSKQISDEQNENFTYFRRPYIEIRDNLGEVKDFKVFNQIEQGFIGDLIQVGNNYIAFGGMSTATGTNTFTDYKPLVIFLDPNLDFIGFKSYTTEISLSDFSSLDNSYHIKKLTNNNFVLYSHNEFRIIDPSGNEMKKEAFPKGAYNQGLICLDEGGFILSTKNYLKKYNTDGELIRSIHFDGTSTPRLIRKGNQIFFASGYPSSYPTDNGNYSTIKILIGSVDLDLNPINLN